MTWGDHVPNNPEGWELHAVHHCLNSLIDIDSSAMMFSSTLTLLTDKEDQNEYIARSRFTPDARPCLTVVN